MSSGEGVRPPRTSFRYSGMSASDAGVPCAIKRTPVFMVPEVYWNLLDSRLLMDVARGCLDVFDGRHRQDAVSEIEDVPWTAAGAVEDVVDGFEDALERREQNCGIEVALHR